MIAPFIAVPLLGKQRLRLATIVMYHSVPPADLTFWIDPHNSLVPEIFERQMMFLATHRHVISVDGIVQALREGISLPRGTVAITFDDGYLDNALVAAPILAKYNLPATIYLATHGIDTGQPQWIDLLYSIFKMRSQQHLSLEKFGLQTWTLDNPQTLQQAYQTIVKRLIVSSVVQRDWLLETIQSQLAPCELPPRLTMNWQEVRQLMQHFPNIEIGVHSVNHLDLSSHPLAAAWEINTSLDRVEQETGFRPRHFAYPYNRYSELAQIAAQKAPLCSAVATNADSVVYQDSNPYALPRLESSTSMLKLRLHTSRLLPDSTRSLLHRVCKATDSKLPAF